MYFSFLSLNPFFSQGLLCYIETYIPLFLRCFLSQLIEKLNVTKHVHNRTKANPVTPLDIEERKCKGEKEGNKDGVTQTEVYIVDDRRPEWEFLWSIVFLVLIGYNCRGLYLFVHIFIDRDQKISMFPYVMIEKVYSRFIVPTDCVKYSRVSCQLSAQLQMHQGGWEVKVRDVNGLCLFGGLGLFFFFFSSSCKYSEQ